MADVKRPDVVEYVKEFQQLVDHYMPGTIPLNTKIVRAPVRAVLPHAGGQPREPATGKEKAIGTDGTASPSPPSRTS